jgi:hypothetical protein
VISIRKLDLNDGEVFRYSGRLVEAGPDRVLVEATFTRRDIDAGYVVFRTGDRYLEWFYADRWYNIFELHDVSDDHLKGWYCNITYPAQISAEDVAWADLALDVFVSPDGVVQVVDQDEFDALQLSEEARRTAWDAVDALRAHVARREPPFDGIGG